MLYVLLCGYPPFESENEVDLKKEITTGGIKFDEDDWSKVSDEARNLVKDLLTIDNEKRIRADQIINHPWMVIEARRANLNSVQENIKKFRNKLRQVMNALRAVRIMQGLRIK